MLFFGANIKDRKSHLGWWRVYIPLGNMLTAAAMIGIDSCPIEGFNREAVSQLLESECGINPADYLPAYMAAFGYRKNEQPGKHRKEMAEIIEWVR